MWFVGDLAVINRRSFGDIKVPDKNGHFEEFQSIYDVCKCTKRRRKF